MRVTLGAATAARKLCEIEGKDTGNERTAQRRFNRFNSADLALIDHFRIGRLPVWLIEATKEAVENQQNKWDCSDGGLDWLAMEPGNGTARRRIVDYGKLMCNQQLYRGKPLHKVMDIIRTVHTTCPAPCECAMTHVVSDSAGVIIPLITVDCAGHRLPAPPATLPPSTTTLRLESNKLSRGLLGLQNAFGDEAQYNTTINNWFAEFKRGHVNLSDEFRDDRLSTAVNNKNIDAVRRMIQTDSHVIYHEIQASLVLAADPTQFD
ncbi:hypothetical protein EVAR_14249_1 [Eumeta japonica]|uniref:Mos1 transposase HTH domain-containing protein n=1 Tax=Eumeta variegata TaxID=151549 RepID=A0A4C1W8N1_EUMVA|nr:hypothetical protein EVAR_14249_1 [Eumeta japonica]